jgi:adhesin transport system membrane fusion protein
MSAARLTPEDAPFVIGPAGADLQGPGRFAHLLLVVIALFFLLFLTWAHFATLDEVTRGDGRVIPSSQVQVVQNLEGGIVADIMMREGAIVEKGEVLLRIENVRAASELRGGRQRYLNLLASIARLQAEIAETGIRFPPEVMAEARQAAINETDLFNARQDSLQSELQILQNQAQQREQEVAELKQKVDLLRLQREVNDLQGELESTRLALPRVELALREANRRIEERILGFRAEAQRELNTLQAEAGGLAELLEADSDPVARTDVRSPVRGTIKQLFVNTLGGVVQPGEDLAEIVPLEDTLLVEAKVRPADIAFLRPGQAATVKVTAYDFSIYGGLDAVVEDISADTIIDEDGERFYRIRVRTSDSTLEKAGVPLPIIPGMTTQVDILTGEKTVMDYLLKPILRARQNALRER